MQKRLFGVGILLTMVFGAGGAYRASAEALVSTSTVPVLAVGGAGAAPATSCVSLGRTLARGATDVQSAGEVTRLQQFLGIMPATGWFGAQTEAAVGRWQIANGLLPATATAGDGLGMVGPKTRVRMAAGCAPATATTTLGKPEATFDARMHDAVMLRYGIHSCDFTGPGCGTFWVTGTATNTRSITLVDFDLYNPITSGDITYNETTGEYSGTLNLAQIRAANADIEDAAAAYLKEVAVENGVWRAQVGVTANGGAHLALVDTSSGQLLDFDIFKPKSVAWVRDENSGWEAASGRRIYGVSTVPNLTLEVWTYTGSNDRKVYETPLRVSRNRWSHRVSADLPDGVYQIYLRAGQVLVYKSLYDLNP